MPQQAATIESLPMAFEVMKEMQITGLDRDEGDRRNGFYRRHLLTELGDIALSVPRTRKVGEVLLPLPGPPVSAATVSRVTLDAAVANRYKASCSTTWCWPARPVLGR